MNLTISELAKLSGLSYNTVYDICTFDSNYKINTLSKILKALGLELQIKVNDPKYIPKGCTKCVTEDAEGYYGPGTLTNGKEE
jgi:transcriptional regulator with XRE-family HTH domain